MRTNGGTNPWLTKFNPNDPYRSNLSDDEYRRQARLNVSTMSCSPIPNSPKVRPAAARSRMFAVAIALVLGAVFYGLNNTSVNQAGTSPPARPAQTQPANRRRRLRACVT